MNIIKTYSYLYAVYSRNILSVPAGTYKSVLRLCRVLRVAGFIRVLNVALGRWF